MISGLPAYWPMTAVPAIACRVAQLDPLDDCMSVVGWRVAGLSFRKPLSRGEP